MAEFLHSFQFALNVLKWSPLIASPLSTSLCVSSSRHLADCLLRAETSWGSLPIWAFLISLMLFVISLCALSALESTSGAFKNIIQLHYDAALTRRKCSTMLSIVMRIVLSPFASSPAIFSPTFSDLSSTEKFKFQSYIKRIKQEGRQDAHCAKSAIQQDRGRGSRSCVLQIARRAARKREVVNVPSLFAGGWHNL